VVTITEGWGKKFEKEEAPHELERGDLARMHEQGDTDVHTHLMIVVIDMKDPGSTRTLIVDCDEGYEEHTMEGIEDQNLPRRVHESYTWARGQEVPEGVTWEDVAVVAGQMGLVYAVGCGSD
jgi:hypothetical protein